MNNDQDLAEKREEVRRTILALKEKTPTTLVLNLFGRWFPKWILEHGLFYWLLQIILINAVIILPGLVLSLILGEMGKWQGLISSWIVAIELAIYGLIIAHSLFRLVFNEIANRVILHITALQDLSVLVTVCRSSGLYFYAFVLLGLVLWSVWTFVGYSIAGVEVGIGLGYMVILEGCLIGIDLHVVFWMMLLSIRLKTFKFELNSFIPASSEVISNLTDILNKIIYFTGAYFAVQTLFVALGFFGH